MDGVCESQPWRYPLSLSLSLSEISIKIEVIEEYWTTDLQ